MPWGQEIYFCFAVDFGNGQFCKKKFSVYSTVLQVYTTFFKSKLILIHLKNEILLKNFFYARSEMI